MKFSALTPSNLEAKPELITQALQLIETSFNYSKPNSFEIDFYPLFNKENFKNCHILINDKNQVIAHIGKKNRILLNNEQELQCSLWGGIAVDENYRGKGIFKDYFNHLLSLESSSTIQVLWSGSPELYYNFGFELKHQQFEYKQKKNESQFIKKEKSNLSDLEFGQIIALYNKKIKKYSMFKRDLSDWNEWLKVTSADLYIYKEENHILAYFLVNKGQDLTNIIHEHYFDAKLFPQVCSHGNLWTSAEEFPYEPEQIYYLALFKNDSKISNLWINGIDSI